MAAATQSFPVTATSSGDISQAMGLPSYNLHVKQEIVDTGYGNQSPQVNGNTLLEKVKRSYTRKPKSDKPGPKAKKVKTEPTIPAGNGGQTLIQDHMPVQKKKRDRFKGTTEEEVLTRVLPDHIKEDLDILIVGINPGLTAAYIQHHYAGPGNHFWKCLHLSGITPQPMNAMQDAELLNYGIGFTNIVARTTRGSADLSRKEIAEGGEILKGKMLKYLPKIALFNGKGIYEVFCGHKNFYFGLQPDPFPGCPDTCVFVNPSSSARCTQLPRAVDKVPFYEALKRVRDYIRVNGSIDGIDRSTVTFPDFKLVTAPQKVKKEIKEEPVDTAQEASAPKESSGGNPTSQVQAKKVAKPRKPRAPRQKKGKQNEETPNVSMPLTVVPQSDIANTNYINQHIQQSMTMNSNNQVSQPIASISGQHPMPPMADLIVKREIIDPMQADGDLAAVIRHNFTSQQDLLLQQQSLAPALMKQADDMSHNLMMPTSNQSMVKQERADWSGYGVMPNCTSAPSAMSAYQQYQCFWNYLPGPTSGGVIGNPYSSIPTSQMPHHNMPASNPTNICQPNVNIATVTTYNSPQEASSPAMSTQSNLTQASLDSLPKADSASTVANWLQNIPNMSVAQ